VAYEHPQVWRDDPRWSGWLDALPGLVADRADAWELEVGPPFTNSHASLAMPATGRDGRPLVLKLQLPDRESRFEAAALARWNGDGAVSLIAHDESRRALLLERCEPGLPLSTLEARAALDVMVDLLPRLWVPAAEPFRSLSEEAGELAREMHADWERTGRSVEARLIDAATEAFRELAATQGEQVLVNQDLHADNVLSARREPWLLIDPKPLVGEREFGVAAIVRGGELGRARDAVIYRLDRVSAELGLDRDRVRLWTMAHTISWAFEGEAPLPGHVETATWLLEAG
jgi:streptomycin 6-kinase